MPLRGDFDVEYDNDAELLLAEMEFNGKSILLKFKLKNITLLISI
jgi:transcriptional adapter 2-alpha